jgi:3-hydroxyisobutyrate dehydrogenase-like beta-hydroxyacid dehydrogenase
MLTGVGVAGCGRMGAPMLDALRKAGFKARGFDIRPPGSFGALAPAVTDSPETFADDLRVLLTVVRDIPQTEELLFGAQRLVRRAGNLETIVICSTLSPRYVRELSQRIPARIALIDAPMSGAAIAAEEARLSFMLGGSAAEIDRLMPLFRAMGQHFHIMGDFGSGMAAKVLNNLLAATNTAVTRLVLDWADAQGIDEARLLHLIATSSGQNWLASGFEKIEFARDGYDPENTIGILIKDIDSALDGAPESAEAELFRAVQHALMRLPPRPRR